jgi:hypothetical protein
MGEPPRQPTDGPTTGAMILRGLAIIVAAFVAAFWIALLHSPVGH